MSTVGYGDQIPKTIRKFKCQPHHCFLVGKTIASGAILSGVLVLALPITVIGTFVQYIEILSAVIVDNFMKVSGSVQPRSAIHRPKPISPTPASPVTDEKAQLTST